MTARKLRAQDAWWTEAKIAKLQDLYALGLSFDAMAGPLDCTRNKVAGKVGRLIKAKLLVARGGVGGYARTTKADRAAAAP